MKGDESNLSVGSKTNCTGSLDGQFQNACVSSRFIQGLSALQQTATNSLESISATKYITSTKGTICEDASEPVFLNSESVSEEKEIRTLRKSLQLIIAQAIPFKILLKCLGIYRV